jgi:hypothetical protein
MYILLHRATQFSLECPPAAMETVALLCYNIY